LLLQPFRTVRSERQLMQQITYNMLFRWFISLAIDAPVWDVTVFTKNRDRLLEGDIARRFLGSLLADPKVAPLLSSDHFSVDGALIEAWASMKSSGLRTAAANRPPPGAMVSAISIVRSGAMQPTPRPPTPMLGCSANPLASPRSSVTWGTC